MSEPYRPCRDPKNNPDDWFIERDGKQYPDDEWPITATEVDEILDEAQAAGKTLTVEEAKEIAAERHKRDALRRRRRAKDLCYTECEWRTQCLALALDGPNGEDVDFGTRGGYYPEELRQVAKLRAKLRASRDE